MSLRRLSLTRRQIEVMEHLVAGKGNKEIGEVMGLSKGSVSKHLKRIYLNLGASNRTHAAVLFVRRYEYGGQYLYEPPDR